MNLLMPHVSSRLFGVPLIVDAGKAAAIIAGLGGRISGVDMEIEGVEAINHVAFSGGRPSHSLGVLGDRLGQRYEQNGQGSDLLPRIGSVGVIGVEGTLVHKGKFVGSSSGETSYEGITAQAFRALRDPSIKAAVYEVDSFGGEAAGAFDAADTLFELSQKKPTIAILTDFALSGGYLLASTARQIVIPETGAAGSIGVIELHADLSQKLASQGVKVTVISSGAHKADGHPASPLSPEVLSKMQADLDKSRELFASAVGRYRGSRLDKSAALATEADSYRGADAVAAGLADVVARPSEAFNAFLSAFR